MAGDWIKWTKGVARKPEVLQIAQRLGKTRHEVAGLLMELWEWADENVIFVQDSSVFDPDNCPAFVRLGDCSTSLIDALAGVAGLADSLTAVGWLCPRNGSLEFPNFGRHNGKSAKSRALDYSRKRAERQKDVPNPSGSHPDKTRTRDRDRGRDREKKNPPNPPLGGGGWFESFWGAYPRKTAKPAALKAWGKLAPDAGLVALILAALDRHRASEQWRRDGGQFIPHPATWLNQRRWEDELPPPGPKRGPGPPLFTGTTEWLTTGDVGDERGDAI